MDLYTEIYGDLSMKIKPKLVSFDRSIVDSLFFPAVNVLGYGSYSKVMQTCENSHTAYHEKPLAHNPLFSIQ